MREHAGVTREELKQSAAVTVAVLMALGLAAAWSVLIPGVDAWENIVAAMRHAARSMEIAELAVRYRDVGVVGFDIAG
ncbi:hypothetical protein AB0H81_21815, partial [Nonomuraea sp. NPDC050691]